MRTQATVVACDGAYILAACDRQSACQGCHKLENEGDCSICSLMSRGSAAMQTRAYNSIGASVGDVVILESKDSRMLSYAFLVFLLPILLFFGAYWALGRVFATDAYRALGAIVVFVISFLGIRCYSERCIKQRVDVVAIEIVVKQQLCQADEDAT